MRQFAKKSVEAIYRCPKCDSICKVGNAFYFRPKFYKGAICTNCNALWEIPELPLEEMLKDRAKYLTTP